MKTKHEASQTVERLACRTGPDPRWDITGHGSTVRYFWSATFRVWFRAEFYEHGKNCIVDEVPFDGY